MRPSWDDDGLFYFIIIATGFPVLLMMPWFIQLLWAALGFTEMVRRETDRRMES